MLENKIKKKSFSWKDFLLGNNHLCVRCEKRVHKENYDFFLKICDNCGINASLLKALAAVCKKET